MTEANYDDPALLGETAKSGQDERNLVPRHDYILVDLVRLEMIKGRRYGSTRLPEFFTGQLVGGNGCFTAKVAADRNDLLGLFLYGRRMAVELYK